MTAATVPQAAFGTALSWAGHDVGHIVGGTYTGISAETIETSDHDSSGGFKEYLAAMRDGGEINAVLRYITGDTTGQKFMYADSKDGTERQSILTFPDSTTFTVNAICTKFGDITFEHDGVVDVNITLKITGEPTFSEE